MHYVAAKLTHQEETNLGMHFEDLFKIKMEKKQQWLGKVVLALNLASSHEDICGSGVTYTPQPFSAKRELATLPIRNKEGGLLVQF